MELKSRETWLEELRSVDPEFADEIAGWRCPDCGGQATTISEDCSATFVQGRTDAARMSLAHGIDPGPPQTEVRPVTYDLTYGCENGHEHYIRTRYVGKT